MHTIHSKWFRGEGEGGEVATWATSNCTMTDGKQAAWATMLSAGDCTGTGTGDSGSGSGATASPPPPPPPSVPEATLTGSDLVKGGDTPVLLASDSLGRVGLLRYPAQLPPEPTAPAAAPAPPIAGGVGGEEGAVDADAPPVPTPEEVEAAATAAAAAMAEAVDAAVPRVRLLAQISGVVLPDCLVPFR